MANIIKNRQFDLYGKSAACQFKLQKLADTIGDGKTKEGYHLFVDAANAKPGETHPPIHYDWENKVSMRLSLADIGTFLNGFRLQFSGSDPKDPTKPLKFELYHDPGKGSSNEGQKVKSMGIQKGTSYGYQIYFRQTEKVSGSDDKKTSIMVPVRDGDMAVLKILLDRAVIMLAGFHGED